MESRDVRQSAHKIIVNKNFTVKARVQEGKPMDKSQASE